MDNPKTFTYIQIKNTIFLKFSKLLINFSRKSPSTNPFIPSPPTCHFICKLKSILKVFNIVTTHCSCFYIHKMTYSRNYSIKISIKFCISEFRRIFCVRPDIKMSFGMEFSIKIYSRNAFSLSYKIVRNLFTLTQ